MGIPLSTINCLSSILQSCYTALIVKYRIFDWEHTTGFKTLNFHIQGPSKVESQTREFEKPGVKLQCFAEERV